MPETMELFEDTMRESAGFRSLRERGIVVTDTQRAMVTNLIYNGIYEGKRLSHHHRALMIEEALTTSDFPLLFGDVLARLLLPAYKAVESAWRPFTKMSTVSKIDVDERRFVTYGGDNLLPRVGEKGEYLASPRNELRYLIQANKRGRQFDLSWEAIINDVRGALMDAPERFGRAAERTEHRLITSLYASDVGAHTEGAGGDLYQVGVNAAATLLSVPALEVGVQTMNMFTDIGGEPIMATPRYMVVPPALEFTALRILNSTLLLEAAAAGTPVGATNVITQANLTRIVDKYLPVVTTGADQHTQWYLFSNPSDLAALEAAHLTGHENPEIAMKSSDKVSIGGGLMSPFEGDFATDNIFYRVRHIFGGAKLDWRATYMGGYLA